MGTKDTDLDIVDSNLKFKKIMVIMMNISLKCEPFWMLKVLLKLIHSLTN